MKLGIGSYTFTWAVGVPGQIPPTPLKHGELLKRAAGLGVKVVQFADNLPLGSLSADEADNLARFAAELGLEIEVGTRGINEPDLLHYLHLVKRFKAPFLRVVVDSPGDHPAPDETISRLQRIMPRFREAGVKLAIENHDRFSSAELARIVQQLGPPDCGICLDTVNSFGALEGPEQVVKNLAPYTLNLHVKDFTIQRVPSQMGFVISGSAAGRGRLNVPWLIEALRTAGANPNAILELWTPPAANLEETIRLENNWAEESIRYLRTLIPD